MAESNKFGNPRLQFGDTTPGSRPDDDGRCSQCEAMLADALDQTLSGSDQALFDSHVAMCGPCAQLLADAQRGAAWLEILRDPQPEPHALLLERILEQTSGLAPATAVDRRAGKAAGSRGVVLRFPRGMWAAARRGGIGQIVLQPRLAMTAAMAFFSIALTMDITGTRLQDLRPGNLRPSSLKRGFYSANARVEKYYENLRVVYDLESRVREMETVRGDDTQSPARESAPAPKQPDAQPQPGAEPGQSVPEHKGSRPSVPSGSVRREQPASGIRSSGMTLAGYEPRGACGAAADAWMWTNVREGQEV